MPDDKKPDEKGTQDEPKFVTADEVGRMVHGAMTDLAERKLPGLITKSLESVNLADTIKAEVAKLAPPKDDPKGSDDGGKPTVPPEVQAQLETLAASLEQEKAARENAERSRVELEQQHRRAGAKTAFRDAVSDKIRGDLLPVFVNHYADSQGLLSVNDEGVPLLKVKKAPYKGAPEEDVSLPLDQAVPILLAQKDVHPFLPAPGGQQGDGDQKRRGPLTPPVIPAGADGDDVSKADRVVQRLSEMGVEPGF
jgi:hypothetical protein